MKPKKNPAFTAMTSSQKPKANPARKKPKANPMNDPMSPQSVEKRSVRAMASGGKCRGMGAATKGGRYGKAG